MDYIIAFAIGVPYFTYMVLCWNWYFEGMREGE